MFATTNVTQIAGSGGRTAEIYVLIGIFVGIIGILSAIWKISKWARVRLRVWDAILGVPSSPGVHAQPSFIERMDAFEAKIDILTKTSEQLLPNGGSTMADKINRTSAQVTHVAKALDDHLKASKAIEEELRAKKIIGQLK